MKMKKIALVVLVLIIAISGYEIFNIFNNNKSYAVDYMGTDEWYKDYTYTLDDANNTINLTKYNGQSNEVVIQNSATIEGKKYSTVIENAVFRNNEVITSVTFENGIKAGTNLSYLFSECENLLSIDFNDFDTSNVTNMSCMLNGCNKLTNLDLSKFNTSNLVNMDVMFSESKNLTTLDISSFDTTHLTNFVFPFNTLNSLKKIKLGPNFKFEMNDGFIGAFGRGTWLREEDQKEYSILELIRKAKTTSIAGTYTKVSSISDEMSISKQVTFRMTNSDNIDWGDLTNTNFIIDNNRLYAHIDISNAEEYTLPREIEYKIIDGIEDKDNNKFDLLVKVNDIKFNNITGADTPQNVYIFLLTTRSFENYVYDSLESAHLDNRHPIRINQIIFNVELKVVDKNGVAQEGSYIFATNDMDGLANGNSEGVKLISGFDTETLTFSNPTNLIQNEKGILAVRGDNATELSEFLVKLDAKSAKFIWYDPLSLGGGFSLYYQPQIVSIKNITDKGEYLPNEKLALFDKDGNKIKEWVTGTDDETVMLNTGPYVIKCVEPAEGYKRPDDVHFSVRDGAYQNAKKVSVVEVINYPYDYEYTINYIDKRTNEVIKTEKDSTKYNLIIKAIDYKINIPKYIYDSCDKEEIKIVSNPANNVINLYYNKISDGVIEKHIDIDTNKVLYENTITGNVGDEYNILSRSFEGYNLVEDRIPTNSKGTMNSEVIEVIYYYQKKASVTVKYIDKETNEEIVKPEIIDGHLNDSYTTKAKEIKDYKLVNNPENKEGTMKETNIEVIYYYEKVVMSPQTSDSSHLIIWISLIIVSIVGIVIIIKRIKK